jgi:hypothetical protein
MTCINLVFSNLFTMSVCKLEGCLCVIILFFCFVFWILFCDYGDFFFYNLNLKNDFIIINIYF